MAEKTIDDYRRELAIRCYGIGLLNLAKVAVESSDPAEITAAAELDVIEAGVDPAQAWRAVSAGAWAYQLNAVLRKVSEYAWAPDVGDPQ